MKISALILLVYTLTFSSYTQNLSKSSENIVRSKDTLQVMALNEEAFDHRLIDPEITIRHATRALRLAKELDYTNGIGESYRVIGVGKYYLNSIDAAIENYLLALSYFKLNKNEQGEARVYNNIGNLYRDIDYNKSMENFHRSLKLAKKLKMKDLIAGLYLNIGTINQRKNNFRRALSYNAKSLSMFKKLNNVVGMIQSQQNLGLIYFSLGKLEKSKEYLIDAKKKAQANKLNNSVANIDLTLSSVYISEEKFELAQEIIREGSFLANLIKDSKLEYDYILISYELESKRKNYEQALYYLQQVYRKDSVSYKSNISDKISLLEAQHRQLEKQKENELTIAEQKNTRIMLWASCIVALLSFCMIFILVKNVKRSALTNKELIRLNEAVSKQKDDLDRTNQNLEEIIEERTKDLKNKNKKLSEYSSHLSHQIRSPVATLKGLMLLENDNLIGKEELVEQLEKCINDLDDRIININENLNNPNLTGLIGDD